MPSKNKMQRHTCMKKKMLLLSLVTMLFSTGCGNGSFRNYSNASGEEYYDTTLPPPYTSRSLQDSATHAADCVRGTPAPIVKKETYPDAQFTLKKDSLTGIETVALKIMTGSVLPIQVVNILRSSSGLKLLDSARILPQKYTGIKRAAH